jgi:transposase-like protein
VSSRNYDKLLVLFESLPSDERKGFIAVVKDSVKANSFGLSDLVASKENGGIQCPRCMSLEPKGIVRFGIRKGIQWYRCKDCSRTFSGVTDSFLSYTKKDFYTWKLFLKCMMEGYSVRRAATIYRINKNTAFMWRHKILDALSEYHSTQPSMKGIVEADDTFFKISYKGSKPIGRDAHQRGEPADTRGISKKNKICVSCAVDRNGQTYSRVSARGKPSATALEAVFRNRISKKSVVCTDSDRAYIKYAERSPFKHIRVPNGIRKLGIYHVQNINGYHSRLKGFLRRFKGVATKYLNNYLIWCNLIQEGARSRIELLKLAIQALVTTRWADISDRPAVPIALTPAILTLAARA